MSTAVKKQNQQVESVPATAQQKFADIPQRLVSAVSNYAVTGLDKILEHVDKCVNIKEVQSGDLRSLVNCIDNIDDKGIREFARAYVLQMMNNILQASNIPVTYNKWDDFKKDVANGTFRKYILSAQFSQAGINIPLPKKK